MTSRRPLRILLLYACSQTNATFSYQQAWPRHFAAHSLFACAGVNLADRGAVARLRAHARARFGRYDAVVLLHSVFSNACYLEGPLFDVVADARQPKALFIGNEYKMMPEKMAFCERLGISLLITQTTSAAVHGLYRERLGCVVAGIPHTGLDPFVFRPTRPVDERPIDLGYRSVATPWYLGHQERERMADHFRTHACEYGVTVDISLDDAARFDETQWADFLNRCRGQLGTEAGGDYFDLTDATRNAVNAYLEANPSATVEDVHARFFRDFANPTPIRILSGRNIEAAGTKTAQILFEGRYDGFFEPDVHYLPLKKDFSNVDDVMAKFQDSAYRARIVENAYDLAHTKFTYDRLIGSFHQLLAPLV